MLRTPRRFAAALAGLVVALGLTGEATAQGLDVMRSTGRAVERVLSGQVARALQPVLSVRGLYDTPPRAVALTPDGTRLAVVTGDGGLRVHALDEGVEILRRDDAGARAAVFGPDGGLAVLGVDGGVRYARALAGPARGALDLPAPARAIAFAGGLIAAGHGDGGVTLTGAESGRLLARAPATGSAVTALSALGTGVVVGHADGSLRVIDAGGNARALASAGAEITALAPAGQGRVAVASADGRVRLIAPDRDRVLAEWRAHGPGAVAIAAGGERIATASREGGAILWDGEGDERARLLAPDAGPVTALAAGAPGEGLRVLAAGPDTGLVLLDAGGTRRATLYPTRRGWGAVDARGRFDGDESAFDDLAWSAEDLRLPVERYARGYFEPGLLYKHLLGGDRFLTRAEAVVTEGLPAPPEAEIAVTEAADAPGGTISVRVVARAPAALGVSQIRLFQNGKRLGPDAVLSDESATEGNRAVRRTRFAVPALAGENRLRAVARDGAGIDSAPAEAAVRIAAEDSPGTLHLTSIGINRYANSELDLNYAVADARGVAEILPDRGAALFGRVERDLVLDADATRAGISSALERLRGTSPRDAAVLFMAGHAVTLGGDWHFLGHGLRTPKQPGHVQKVGISGEDLVAALTEVPARRLLLVVDACFAGAILGPFERFSQRRAMVDLQQQTGIVVIAATRADQEAPEFPRLGHGLMTYVLLQGLKAGDDGRLQADTAPRDGRITANELRLFVEKTVPGVAALLDDSLGRGAGGAGGVTPVGLALGSNFELAR